MTTYVKQTRTCFNENTRVPENTFSVRAELTVKHIKKTKSPENTGVHDFKEKNQKLIKTSRLCSCACAARPHQAPHVCGAEILTKEKKHQAAMTSGFYRDVIGRLCLSHVARRFK